jgi:hypothetical protein
VNGEGAGCVGLLGPRKSWANGFSQAGQKPEMRGEKDFLIFQSHFQIVFEIIFFLK